MAIFIDVVIEGSDVQPLRLKENIYLYLHPMFEQINSHTGRYVNLKEDCVFPVDNLPVLQKHIFEKKHAVRQLKPVCITFICGTIISKNKNGKTSKKNNILEIDKNELLYFLREIGTFIDLARQKPCSLKFKCVK